MRISDWSSDVRSDATSSGRWVGVRSFFADALRTPVDEKIERRQHQQRKDRGGQHSSNNYSGERALHLGACSDVKCHGDKPERSYQRGHQDWTKAGKRSMPDGFEQILSSHSQITDEGKHHNPVEDGDPRKGDETHTRGDPARNAAHGERCHTSEERRAGKESDSTLSSGW